jgi:FkbM family methyltransferase
MFKRTERGEKVERDLSAEQVLEALDMLPERDQARIRQRWPGGMQGLGHEQVLDALNALPPGKQAFVRKNWAHAKTLSYDEVLEGLRTLSPSKQLKVFEEWKGLEVETPEGLRTIARTRKEVGRFKNGQSRQMTEWMRQFEEGDVFYDIGANVGAVSLAAGAIHRNRLRIVAIEPATSSFDTMVRNLSLNGFLSSTIPIQAALLDRTKLEPLNYYDTTAAGTSFHAVGQAVDFEGKPFTPAEVQLVPTFALDDLIRTLELPAPTVVKIDVDGYEEQVLRGATSTLQAGTVRELEIEVVDHDRAGTRLRAVAALLAEHGYEQAETAQHDSHGEGESFVADYLFKRKTAQTMQTTRPAASI